MLNVLYEDNHILVVEKPSGVLSQEDHTKDADMLNLCKAYIKEKYNKPGDVYLGLVQRLDRMTSGVMVFARTSKAASRLSEQVRNHDILKKYYAVVEGNLTGSGTLCNYLYKNEEEVKSYVGDSSNGKKAILDYEVISHYDDKTLVNVILHTGRHHQIRVQLSHLGYPLYGDTLYGAKSLDTIRLHAYYLSFVHPITHEVMKFNLLPHGKIWDQLSF